MNWEKSSTELVDLWDELAPVGPDIENKKMFGWPCAFVRGNLFAGLHKQSILFRLSASDQASLLRLEGATEFEPMPGRKMKGYVILSNPLERNRKEISKWIDLALRFASALPAKAKKTAAKKAVPKRGSAGD